MRFKILRLGLLVTIISCLISCSQYEIEYHANGYNRAIENSTNSQLLLNIVRASKQLPLHFTGIGGYKGGQIMDSNIKPTFKFSPYNLLSYDIGSVLNTSSGLSSLEVGNLNNDEALTGLNQSVPPQVWDRYSLAGVHSRLIMNLIIDGIIIEESVFQALAFNFQERCPSVIEANRSGITAICAYTKRLHEQCGSAYDLTRKYKVSQNSYSRAFINHGKSRCAFIHFQEFLSWLTLAEFSLETEEYFKIITKDEKSLAVPRYRLVVHFANKRVNSVLLAKNTSLKKVNRRSIDILLRSPKRMIEFLGGLTALQNRKKSPFQPKIHLVNGETTPLFVLKKNSNAIRDILTVKGPGGQKYSIPKIDDADPSTHMSLVSLSMVNDLVNLAIKKSSLPATTTLDIRAIQ